MLEASDVFARALGQILVEARRASVTLGSLQVKENKL